MRELRRVPQDQQLHRRGEGMCVMQVEGPCELEQDVSGVHEKTS